MRRQGSGVEQTTVTQAREYRGNCLLRHTSIGRPLTSTSTRTAESSLLRASWGRNHLLLHVADDAAEDRRRRSECTQRHRSSLIVHSGIPGAFARADYLYRIIPGQQLARRFGAPLSALAHGRATLTRCPSRVPDNPSTEAAQLRSLCRPVLACIPGECLAAGAAS